MGTIRGQTTTHGPYLKMLCLTVTENSSGTVRNYCRGTEDGRIISFVGWDYIMFEILKMGRTGDVGYRECEQQVVWFAGSEHTVCVFAVSAARSRTTHSRFWENSRTTRHRFSAIVSHKPNSHGGTPLSTKFGKYEIFLHFSE